MLMNTQVGLWIDHRKTGVVVVTDKGEKTELITSGVEKQLRRSGDSPLKGPYESQRVPEDNSRDRSFTANLGIYYNEVMARIREAGSILIFGPGEAKGELRALLEKNDLGNRISGFETVDKMTDGQIAAKVRKHFARP
jgi:hypothetical protein